MQKFFLRRPSCKLWSILFVLYAFYLYYISYAWYCSNTTQGIQWLKWVEHLNGDTESKDKRCCSCPDVGFADDGAAGVVSQESIACTGRDPICWLCQDPASLHDDSTGHDLKGLLYWWHCMHQPWEMSSLLWKFSLMHQHGIPKTHLRNHASWSVLVALEFHFCWTHCCWSTLTQLQGWEESWWLWCLQRWCLISHPSSIVLQHSLQWTFGRSIDLVPKILKPSG